jgi:hypothetical protein
MRSRILPLAALGCLVLVPAIGRPDDAPATKKVPALVVRLRSFNSTIADLSYLAAQVGKEEEAKQAVEMLKERIGPKGLDGIDVDKPFGGYVFAGPNGTDSYGAFMLPVKDEEALLKILANNGLKADKGKDGLYTIKDERFRVPIFFRFANGYAYVAPLSEAGLAKSKLVAPSEVLPEGEKALLSATIRIDQIPDNIKEIALAQVGLRVADIREQHSENGTPAQKELIDKSSKEANAQVKALVNDGRELAIRVDVDRKNNDLALKITFDGKTGTKLAASITELGNRQSLFAGLLGKDSAFSVLFSYALPERVQKALGPVVDEAIKEMLEQAKDETHKQLAEKLFRVLAPSIKAGEIDAAVDVRGPSANKHYTLVGGIKLKNGDEIGTTLKEIVKDLPQEVRDLVKIDADKTGNVNIHRIEFDRFLDDNARTVFGNGAVFVAVRSNAIYWAVGENGLEALKAALAAKPGTAGLFQLNVSLAQLVPIMAKHQPAAPKAAEEAFAKNPGADKISVSVTGGKALKAEVHVKAAVLKFLAALHEANANSEQ